VLSGTECTAIEDCGCVDEDDNYHPDGTSWTSDDCTTRYHCDGTVITEEDLGECDENAQCVPDGNGDYECECDDGYTGDGRDCDPDGGTTNGDPHFLIHSKPSNVTLCFDIGLPEGEVITLLHDKENDILINGKAYVVTDIKHSYFSDIAIFAEGVAVIASLDGFYVNGIKYPWTMDTHITKGNARIFSYGKKRVDIQMGPTITFRLLKTEREHHKEFVGLFIVKEAGLSTTSGGVIGEFLHKEVGQGDVTMPTQHQRLPHATLHVSSARHQRDIPTTLHRRHNGIIHRMEGCWYVEDEGRNLLDGEKDDYVVPSLFDHN